MKTIASYEAKSRFSQVLQAVSKGETFIITRNGTKMAELRPCTPQSHRRVRGAMKDKFGPVSPDFHQPLPEFEEYQ